MSHENLPNIDNFILRGSMINIKIKIIQLTEFKKELKDLISKNKLLEEDFEDFKKELAENPTQGEVVPGVGGMRKIRIKSSSEGEKRWL